MEVIETPYPCWSAKNDKTLQDPACDWALNLIKILRLSESSTPITWNALGFFFMNSVLTLATLV